MNRLGLNSNEIDFLLKNREMVNNLKWDFIKSHLANSEDLKNNKNNQQLNEILKFSRNFPHIKLSLSN